MTVQVAFGDVADSRVGEAARILVASGLVMPVLIGGPGGAPIDGTETVEVHSDTDELSALADYVRDGHAMGAVREASVPVHLPSGPGSHVWAPMDWSAAGFCCGTVSIGSPTPTAV